MEVAAQHQLDWVCACIVKFSCLDLKSVPHQSRSQISELYGRDVAATHS